MNEKIPKFEKETEPSRIIVIEKPKTELKEEMEIIPTLDEVMSVLTPYLEGIEKRIERLREDEKGLYLVDIKVPKGGGGYSEYLYMRKGKYPEGSASATAIHVARYDKHDGYDGGGAVAKLMGGKWKIITTPSEVLAL